MSVGVAEGLKPPPIVVGVSGIDAFAGYREPVAPGIDWNKLIGLPPFQMFAAETFEFPADQYMQAMTYILHHNSSIPGALQKLFDGYCQWHAAKGHWPNETPTGELINA